MRNLPKINESLSIKLSVIILAAWSALTLYTYLGTWPPDLSALYLAAHFYEQGTFDQIFAAPDGFFGPSIQSWTEEVTRMGYPDAVFFPFVYPPIWAAIFAPLAKLGPEVFFTSFYIVQTAMLAGCVVLAYRIVQPRIPLVYWTVLSVLLMYMSLIMHLALLHNQFQITVTFLTLLAFERYRYGHSITAGVVLGVAAAIKIMPAALGLIFLLDRDFRAALATAVTGLSLLALSLIVTGIPLHLEFLDRLSTISDVIAIMKVNYNLESFFFQLNSLITGDPLHDKDAISSMKALEPLWITILTKIFALGGLALVLWRSATIAEEDRMTLRLFGMLLVITLCAPLGWAHHYLPVLFLLPMALKFMVLPRAVGLVAGFAGLTSFNVFVLVSELSQRVHVQAMANVLFLIVVFLIFFARKPSQRNRAGNMAVCA